MLLAGLLLVILSSLVLWFAYWYFTVRYYEKYLKSIPHPPLTPLVGNALDFTSSITILPTLMKYHREFNGNFKIYLGARPYIFFAETKELECLLNSTSVLRKSEAYRFLHSWLGTGLLTGWGEKWKKHRKIITPAFHFQILEEFVDVFNSAGDILVAKLSEESKKGSIDVYPFVTRCALDIICETAMGTSVNAQDDTDSKYVESVDALLEVLIERTFSPLLHNDFLYRFSKTYQKEQRALKVVHGYSRRVIGKKMGEFLKSRDNEEAPVDALGRKKKKAFLDLLLEYSSKDHSFTYDDICQEVDTFMFEGHDTTATSISFALFSLAANPDVQKKVYDELQIIFGDSKRSASFKDLQKMNYLELVIKESLRIYTTIPFFGRLVEQAAKINDVILPSGTVPNIFSYATQNSQLLYKDPERFNPERFTTENMQGKNPFTYIPFSAGARNCIGQKFAMLEMKSIISNILRNFELFPVVPEHKMVLRSAAVLKSVNGVIVTLKRRAKALDEQKSIFRDEPTRKVTSDDLREMKYLKMVIMEALRMYTTIPAYGRYIEKDTTWNGVTIPKRTMVNISAYCLHHNPDNYPDPETFNPERFNPSNINANSPFAYLPFSAGARNCIGQKFALLTMQTVISKILRHFELRPCVPEHQMILKVEAVLKPINGVFIRLIRRNQSRQ